MNKLHLSILGQPVSFDCDTAFTKNYPLLDTHLVVHTDPEDPRLMISIGGPRPKPAKPSTGRHGSPTVITSDAGASVPPGIEVVEIPLAGQPIDIQQHPEEQMICVSIGGPRSVSIGGPRPVSIGGARPDSTDGARPVRGGIRPPFAIQFDTSGGEWQFQRDLVRGHLIARLAMRPPQV